MRENYGKPGYRENNGEKFARKMPWPPFLYFRVR